MKLTDAAGHHNVYNMMVVGFSHPLVSGFYIIAQVFLAYHLSHGVSSAARTLGVKSRELYERIRVGGVVFAALIALLYISIPLVGFIGLRAF